MKNAIFVVLALAARLMQQHVRAGESVPVGKGMCVVRLNTSDGSYTTKVVL
jgi:hypothetical protein